MVASSCVFLIQMRTELSKTPELSLSDVEHLYPEVVMKKEVVIMEENKVVFHI
jgi:hypothetical protein